MCIRDSLEAEARQVEVVASFESRVYIDRTVCIDCISDVEWQYHFLGSASYGSFQARGNGHRLFVGGLLPVDVYKRQLLAPSLTNTSPGSRKMPRLA